MGIYSEQELWSDDQVITATANSSNVIDWGDPNRVLGAGNQVPLQIQVTDAFVGATSLKVGIQHSTDEAFSSPVVVAESRAVPVAELVAGFDRFNLDWYPITAKGRYSRLVYTVAGGPFSAGAIFAGPTMGHQKNAPFQTFAGAGTRPPE